MLRPPGGEYPGTVLATALATALTEATGQAHEVTALEAVSGGCINTAYRVLTTHGVYFAKVNASDFLAAFRQEAKALNVINATGEMKVPGVIHVGQIAESETDKNNKALSFLLMDFIEAKPTSPSAQALLGRQLARMHRHSAKRYGWDGANYLGATRQQNTWHGGWCEFWQKNRLVPQTELAKQNGMKPTLYQKLQKLIDQTPALLGDHQPQASLLHGDLWSGNVTFAVADAEQHVVPVIFDPACYYGDRETDLAMTELFGGFGQSFYQAYQAEWPLSSGYQQRKPFYNLYHVLNHFNLFAGHYEQQVARMVESIVENLLAH